MTMFEFFFDPLGTPSAPKSDPFDLLTPPQGPKGRVQKNYVARPIYVSNSHTKFGWISSNGLGGDSITDTAGRNLILAPKYPKSHP